MYEYMDRNMDDRNLGQAKKMSANEKRISFLNGYFIYKKVGERIEPKKEENKSPVRKIKRKKKKKVKKLSKETSL